MLKLKFDPPKVALAVVNIAIAIALKTFGVL
jgi:hypothetical protein